MAAGNPDQPSHSTYFVGGGQELCLPEQRGVQPQILRLHFRPPCLQLHQSLFECIDFSLHTLVRGDLRASADLL